MKKLILSVGLFIFLLLVLRFNIYAQSPKSSSAAPKTDCWQVHMNDQMAVCGKASTQCILSCPSQDLKANSVCLDNCGKIDNDCNNTASADYHACIEAQKQPETKQLDPSKAPVPTSSKSSTDFNCWNKYDEQTVACRDTKYQCYGISPSNSRKQTCDSTFDACLNQALADYRGCPEAGRQTVKTQTIPVKNTTSSEGINPFGIFGSNPYETWLNLLSLLNFNTIMEQGAEVIVFGETLQERDQKLQAQDPYAPANWDKLFNTPANKDQAPDTSYIAHIEDVTKRNPELDEEIIRKAQADWDAMFKKADTQETSPFRADIVDGQVQIKYPGETEWKELKVGDRILPGSTIFTGMDTTTVLSIRDKGAIEVLPFTEVTVSEEGLKQAGNEGKTTTDVKLKTGEIEVNVENGPWLPNLQITIPTATVGVRGTHFWVRYNDKTKAAIVGVYKGEVFISSGGKEVSVTPQGDKPGVAVLLPKQSGNYLLWAVGGITILGIGIVLWLLKRRGQSTKGMKRKK